MSVCTDGAPSMTGKREGFIAQVKKLSDPDALISFHCKISVLNILF
jgi:hypothetical protein